MEQYTGKSNTEILKDAFDHRIKMAKEKATNAEEYETKLLEIQNDYMHSQDNIEMLKELANGMDIKAMVAEFEPAMEEMAA